MTARDVTCGADLPTRHLLHQWEERSAGQGAPNLWFLIYGFRVVIRGDFGSGGGPGMGGVPAVLIRTRVASFLFGANLNNLPS